jgi:UDPglucose--hexose-1-phosphate uridylyltransferase
MPEMRRDPILGHWVIISEERGQRPAGGAAEAPATSKAECPFCPGNESETLPEIFSIRDADTAPDSPGWHVRVVPNKYPALRPDETNENEQRGLFARRAGRGHHEVIIEGRAHNASVTNFEPAHMKDVMTAYRDRFRALALTPGLQSALLIKNVGEAAGMAESRTFKLGFSTRYWYR